VNSSDSGAEQNQRESKHLICSTIILQVKEIWKKENREKNHQYFQQMD
jgi:hypothetical protein